MKGLYDFWIDNDSLTGALAMRAMRAEIAWKARSGRIVDLRTFDISAPGSRSGLGTEWGVN